MAENTNAPQAAAEQNTNQVTGADMSGAILQQLLDNAATVKTLQQAHEVLADRFAEQEKQLLTVQLKNEALEKGYTTLIKENVELKKQLDKVGTGTAATTVAADPEKPKLPTELFTVDGKKYKFLLAQWRNPRTKEVVTATDALTDEDLLREMVARKSGAIQEVVE